MEYCLIRVPPMVVECSVLVQKALEKGVDSEEEDPQAAPQTLESVQLLHQTAVAVPQMGMAVAAAAALADQQVARKLVEFGVPAPPAVLE